jgi:hypothetical protein
MNGIGANADDSNFTDGAGIIFAKSEKMVIDFSIYSRRPKGHTFDMQGQASRFMKNGRRAKPRCRRSQKPYHACKTLSALGTREIAEFDQE